jgi:UDP-apiose/xylose synthase
LATIETCIRRKKFLLHFSTCEVNETTIADLATRLIKIYRAHCDPSAEVAVEEISAEEFYGLGYEDCDRRLPDISKLKRLGWIPRFDLNETFTRSAVYFYQNRHRLESLLQRALTEA